MVNSCFASPMGLSLHDPTQKQGMQRMCLSIEEIQVFNALHAKFHRFLLLHASHIIPFSYNVLCCTCQFRSCGSTFLVFCCQLSYARLNYNAHLQFQARLPNNRYGSASSRRCPVAATAHQVGYAAFSQCSKCKEDLSMLEMEMFRCLTIIPSIHLLGAG